MGLKLEPGDIDSRHPQRQAEGGGANSGAQLQHPFARPRRHRRRQQHRIHRHPVAAPGLRQLQPAAEQAVAGDLGVGGGGRGGVGGAEIGVAGFGGFHQPPGRLEIVVGDHQALGQGADAAVEDRHVGVECHNSDPGVGQQRLHPRQAHRIGAT